MAHRQNILATDDTGGLPEYVPSPLYDLGDGTYAPVVNVNNMPTLGLTDAQLRAAPIPVDIQDASVTINGDVTVSNEVEIKNAVGNPVPVSGSVNVSNFPATQPVSAAALPLPTGAATSAKQDELFAHIPDEKGAWGYNAGTAGTLTMTGGKRVLAITAVAQEGAASLTINGGDAVVLPYSSADKASSAIAIEPKANLIDPVIVFTGTKSYFVEYVT